MAYDPKDSADVKIVTDAVKAATDALTETHEAEVEGLKNKNQELLGKIRKARTGDDAGSAAEVERLESELAETQGKLRTAESNLRQASRDKETLTGERDTAVATAATEAGVAKDLIVTSGLTAALVENKVAPQFLDDVTASLARQVTVKEVEGKRKAFVGDKPVGDFVKEWSQGDKGKHYVIAPGNGGGGTQPPGSPPQGGKKLFEMSETERSAAYRADPADFDRRVAAGENKAPAKT